MNHLIVILLFVSYQISLSFLVEAPYFLGTYLLRKTNDKSLEDKCTYLILNDNNNIKLKSIRLNGIFATKISRTGTIEFVKNHKSIFNPLYFVILHKKLNNVMADNDIIINIRLNNVNKYSYSILGVEIPEIRYKQISNYNIQKKLRVRQKNYTLYVTDDKNNYYLFDLNPYMNLNVNRLPFIETAFNTLLFTQIISFIVNLLIVKFFDII
jgi:hypothetical protein